MATTKYRCPLHNVTLKTVEDYEGALIHLGCPEVFTVIDEHLCILEGKQWKDIKTGEYRIPLE